MTARARRAVLRVLAIVGLLSLVLSLVLSPLVPVPMAMAAGRSGLAAAVPMAAMADMATAAPGDHGRGEGRGCCLGGCPMVQFYLPTEAAPASRPRRPGRLAYAVAPAQDPLYPTASPAVPPPREIG